MACVTKFCPLCRIRSAGQSGASGADAASGADGAPAGLSSHGSLSNYRCHDTSEATESVTDEGSDMVTYDAVVASEVSEICYDNHELESFLGKYGLDTAPPSLQLPPTIPEGNDGADTGLHLLHESRSGLL